MEAHSLGCLSLPLLLPSLPLTPFSLSFPFASYCWFGVGKEKQMEDLFLCLRLLVSLFTIWSLLSLKFPLFTSLRFSSFQLGFLANYLTHPFNYLFILFSHSIPELKPAPSFEDCYFIRVLISFHLSDFNILVSYIYIPNSNPFKLCIRKDSLSRIQKGHLFYPS